MQKIFFVFFLIFFLSACKQKKTISSPQNQDQPESNFFPVTTYILGQLNELDSLPITPLKITHIDGKIDSVWLKRKDIRDFAKPFLTPVIDSVNCKKYFIEKSFLDQTINAFTFSYDPVPQLSDSLELKHWDVYIDADNNKVKRIYIVKQLNTDKVKTLQLTWKSGYYCKITTILEQPNKTSEVKEEQLIWNFED